MTPTPRPAGTVRLPTLPAPMDSIWLTILELARRIPPDRWTLIGGQMVVLHGLANGRQPVRITRDVDVLASLLVSSTGIRDCVRAVSDMGFTPQEATDHTILHRFVRDPDRAVVDIVAPDHSPPTWALTTIPPRETIRVEGGTQALERTVVFEVIQDGDRSLVPTPSVLGSLILKAAAYLADSRDRDRHAYDAAFLAGLIEDPRAARATFKGSDRKRLLALDRIIGKRDHPAWRALGDAAEDSYLSWRLLTAP